MANRTHQIVEEIEKQYDHRYPSAVRVHVEMRSKRERWVKPSLNSMEEEGEEMLAKW